MPLDPGQFANAILYDVYKGRGGKGLVPPSSEARCGRMLDALAEAVRPEDLNVVGFGYSLKGAVHSVDVKGNRLTYLWTSGKAQGIDYV